MDGDRGPWIVECKSSLEYILARRRPPSKDTGRGSSRGGPAAVYVGDRKTGTRLARRIAAAMPGGCRSPTTDRARLSSIWRRLCDSTQPRNRDTPLHPSTPLLSSLHELRRHAPHDPPGRCFLSRYPSNQKKIWRGVEGYICPGDGPTLGVVEEGGRRGGGGDCCKSMLHCSISIDMRRSIVGDYRPQIPLQPSLRSGSGVLHVWRPYNTKPHFVTICYNFLSSRPSFFVF